MFSSFFAYNGTKTSGEQSEKKNRIIYGAHSFDRCHCSELEAQ